METNYTLSTSNYNKPTPKWLKFVADILLFISMLGDFATPWLSTMPDWKNKTTIVWIASGAIVLFKFVTKFITEETVVTPNP